MKTRQQSIQVSCALKFRIHHDGQIFGRLSHSDHEFYFSPEVLALLLYFAKNQNKNVDYKKIPTKTILQELKQHFQSIIQKLPTEQECEAIISDLIDAGVLLTDQKSSQNHTSTEGFGDPWIQWAMLADSKRSLAYENAIAQTVSKNAVVLDVGSGTGFLAACALHHGAKNVHAIEASSMADQITSCLKAMKMPVSGVKIHHKNSFDADLPKEINLIISELFGNDPFQEGLYSTLQDVAKRIQNKNAVYIPHKLVIYGEMINLKQHHAKERIQRYQVKTDESFYEKWLSVIKKNLQFDTISFPLNLTANDFERISTSVKLGECHLDPPPLKTHLFKKCFSGEINLEISTKHIDTPVFIFWFRVFLTKNIAISSHPQETDHASHWSPIAVVLNEKITQKSNLLVKYHLSEDASLFECQVFERDRLIGSRRFL